MALTKEVKTGILVIAGILLFIFGYNFLKNSSLFDDIRTFYVKYDNVAGLAPSAPVTINGLQVGKVESIDFENAQGGLLVTFSVKRDFSFSRNSKVQIYSSGFIGGNNLGIVPINDPSNVAKTGDTLVGEIQAGLLDGLMNKLDPIETRLEVTMSKLDTLLSGFNEILDEETRLNLRSSISNLNSTLASFSGASRDIRALMGDNKEKLSNTFDNLDVTAKNFAQLSDSLAKIETGEMVRNMEEAITKFNNIAASIDNGDGSIGKLLKDEKLYDNLNGASYQLEQLLQDMKLNPKRYVHFSLFGRKAKQYEAPKDSIK